MSERVKITCDGSAYYYTKHGGWAVIFRYKEHAKSLYGFDLLTTNNRMELMGPIMALEYLNRPCDIDMHLDSQYVVNGITKWIKNWNRNGFKTAAWQGKLAGEVINKDLWLRLELATKRHQSINWNWVKGHHVDSDNLLCDEIARRAGKLKLKGSAVLSSEVKKIDPKELAREISFSDV